MISTLGMEQSYLCERRQRRPRRDDVQEEKHDDNDKTDEQVIKNIFVCIGSTVKSSWP